MSTETTNSNGTAIVFICTCCGKPAQARLQTYDHPALRNRSLIQVECLTEGCNNHFWTLSYQMNGDNEQLTDRYTPVVMDAGQVERFVSAAKAS